MALPLRSLPAEIFRELKARKGLAFIIFAAVSFSVLVVARQQPWYVSQAVIVLEDSAKSSAGGVAADNSPAAKDSDRVALVLAEIARQGLLPQSAAQSGTGLAQPAEGFDAAETIGQRLSVQPFGNSRLIISYRDRRPQDAFNVMQTLIQGLTHPVVTKKVSDLSADDKVALQKLDEQIAVYRDRVRTAEDRLEKFLQFSPPEVVAATTARVNELEGAMETLDRERDAALKRKRLLESQDEDGPEMQALSAQIEAMSEKKRVSAVALANARAYQEKLLLSGAEGETLKNSLDRENLALADLVGSRDALLSGLAAADGDPGLTGKAGFHLVESASFPTRPEGIHSGYLTYGGLLAGLMAPVVLFGLFCFIDPRVRSSERFESRTGIPVLMSVPALASPLEKRLERNRLFWLLLMVVFVVLAYCYLAWIRLNGGPL